MAPQVRIIEVERIERLSPHMQRIEFSGESLTDFPTQKESAHVKVIVPDEGDYNPGWNYVHKYRKSMRSYTVRSFNAVQRRLVIDFAVNDHVGKISNWASSAQPGDKLAIAGPGGVKHKDFYADWHLFIGDLTALPAIAATLEMLPSNAVGHAFVQVPSEADKQELRKPQGIAITWLINKDRNVDMLENAVRSFVWPAGEPAIFLACEAKQVRKIKSWLRSQPSLKTGKLYDSAYWKQ